MRQKRRGKPKTNFQCRLSRSVSPAFFVALRLAKFAHTLFVWYSIYNKRGTEVPQTLGGFAAEIPFFVWNPAAVITAAGFLFSEKK